ncbi:hypothetical protein MTsPCn7_13720 [Altererythrobacter sp. MTPC7]
MKSIAAAAMLSTSVLALSPLSAQDQRLPTPVEETEVPEDEVIAPQPEIDAMPAEGSGTPVNAASAAATPPAEGEWDVNAPPGATIRQVPIRTDEGTWIDVDVSPDGRTVAFSLLGDIYTMPIGGGAPVRISEGLAWEVHPRFSPDGRRIAFTSDRGGGDNIWIMNADGSNKQQLTKEDFRLLNQPSWSPDGRFIVAKKHFTTGRSLGTGEIWLYHVSGGAGVKLVERPNEQHQKELGEPIYSPDGEAVYFTRNNTSGPIFEYAQDSTQGIFEIERYDLATGERTVAVSGYGGAVRPTPSPDGEKIAFVRRDKDQSQLWVKDIASGREAMIYGELDLDVQETWAVTGVYPNMDWTPDSRAIVFWAGVRSGGLTPMAQPPPKFHFGSTIRAGSPMLRIRSSPSRRTDLRPRSRASRPCRRMGGPSSSKLLASFTSGMQAAALHGVLRTRRMPLNCGLLSAATDGEWSMSAGPIRGWGKLSLPMPMVAADALSPRSPDITHSRNSRPTDRRSCSKSGKGAISIRPTIRKIPVSTVSRSAEERRD